ncbi:retrotransposon-related protein [Tanacetum coccineum]
MFIGLFTWLKIVGFNLEGAAAEWFQWMTRNGLITTWARFEESVRNCFGPSEYEDPNGALSKLLQLGTVKDYQREFEKLMNRATDIPDSLLISFYIFRLKLHLQREFLVSRPTTLGDAFSLALITEACLDDHAALVAGTMTKTFGNNGDDESDSSGPVTPMEVPVLFRRLNAKYIKKKKMKAEFQRRIWKPGIKIVFKTPP